MKHVVQPRVRVNRTSVSLCRARHDLRGCGGPVSEVEVVPGGIRGLAVHETARIMALGKAGEILVSGTTRELSAGSGFTFVDHGVHHLKGIPAPRRVYLLVTADSGGAGGPS